MSKVKYTKGKKVNYRTPDAMLQKFKVLTKKLSMHEKMALTDFLEYECNRYGQEVEKACKERFNSITDALDRTFTASLIQETDFSLEKINEILKISCDLLEEDTKKVKELKNEGNGDWMKAADKQVDQVCESALKLINKGKKQKEAIQILAAEFPMLSKSMITNAYKKVQEKLKEAEDVELEAAATYILGDEEKEDKQKEDNITPEKKVSEKKENSKLKILKKKVILDVEGEFGTYSLEDEIVTVNNIKFKSPEEVEEVFKKQIEQLKKEKEEILSVYELAKKLTTN